MKEYITIENIKNSTGNFYKIPRALMGSEYAHVSAEAKLLYSMMLDRASMSAANGWADSDGRVYIIFTVDEVIEIFKCKRTKASYLLNELDEIKGCNLIKRVRQGHGKANRIYVKFISDDVQKDESVKKEDVQKNEHHTKKGIFNRRKDKKVNVKTFTDVNTNYNNNNHNNIYNLSYQSDKVDEYIDIVRENLCIDLYKNNPGYDCEVEEMADLVEEVVTLAATNEAASIRISGRDMPAGMVLSRFLKLTYEHLKYVSACLKNQYGRIRNVKAYLMTALFNAPATIGAYYTNLVHVHMAESVV